jgi:hypothetical protein
MRKLLAGCLLAFVLGLVPLVALATTNVTIIDESGDQTLEEGYGVITGIHVLNMHAGANVTGPLKIICGKDKARVFSIYVTEPDPKSIKVGYTALPEDCYSWITIGANDVPADAGEVVTVPVTIAIPNDIAYTNRHDAVALFVKDTTQTGFNQIAYKSTWFITTDHEPIHIPGIRVVTDKSNIKWIALVTGIIIVGGSVYLKRSGHAKKT